MKVKRIVLAGLLSLVAAAHSQDYAVGARTQAMGGSGVASAGDPESQFLNPATLVGLPGPGMTLFYCHPFGLQEIKLSSLCASLPWGHIALGAALLRLDHESFADHFYQFAAAWRVAAPRRTAAAATHEFVAVGVQGSLREVRAAGYDNRRAWHLHAGTLIQVSSQLAWGAALHNLVSTRLGGRESASRHLTLGATYAPSPRLALQLDVYKQTNFPLETRAGVEFAPLAPLVLRFGLGSNPDRATFGLALRIRPAALHFTTFSHFDLGWTQQYAATLQRWDQK